MYKRGDKVILTAGDDENSIPLLGLFNGIEYVVGYRGDGQNAPTNFYWIEEEYGKEGGFAKADQLTKVGD